jgi:hypothetical protein
LSACARWAFKQHFSGPFPRVFDLDKARNHFVAQLVTPRRRARHKYPPRARLFVMFVF